MNIFKFKTGDEYEEKYQINLELYQQKAQGIVAEFEAKNQCIFEEDYKGFITELESITCFFSDELGSPDEYVYFLGYPMYTSYCYSKEEDFSIDLCDIFSIHPEATFYKAGDTLFLPYNNRSEFVCIGNNGSGINIVYKFMGENCGQVSFISNFIPPGIDLEQEENSKYSNFRLNKIADSFHEFLRGLKKL